MHRDDCPSQSTGPCLPSRRCARLRPKSCAIGNPCPSSGARARRSSHRRDTEKERPLENLSAELVPSMARSISELHRKPAAAPECAECPRTLPLNLFVACRVWRAYQGSEGRPDTETETEPSRAGLKLRDATDLSDRRRLARNRRPPDQNR